VVPATDHRSAEPVNETPTEREAEGAVEQLRNFANHPQAGRLVLTWSATAAIRHLIYNHNIALTRFPALMLEFYVLIVGRPPTKNELLNDRTLRERMLVMDHLDQWRFGRDLSKYYEKMLEDECTAQLLWFMQTNDSKHEGNRDRHAIIQCCHVGSPDATRLEPGFQLMSVTPSKLKTSNAENNLATIRRRYRYHPALLAEYGGGSTDNAADALKETLSTFDIIMSNLPPKLEPKKMVFGVERRSFDSGIRTTLTIWSSCMHASRHSGS
jgi:hypothetical protein